MLGKLGEAAHSRGLGEAAHSRGGALERRHAHEVVEIMPRLGAKPVGLVVADE